MKLEKFTRHDVITPANAITLLGLILVLCGCFRLNSVWGLILVALGRFMDLLDGPVARATKSTRFSTVFDPFTDKIALAAIIFSVLWFQLVPWPVALFIALQNVAMTALALKTYERANKLGATVLGKLNMFAQTTTILLFIASSLAQAGLHELLTVLAYANFITCVGLGLLALGLYTRMLRKTLQQH